MKLNPLPLLAILITTPVFADYAGSVLEDKPTSYYRFENSTSDVGDGRNHGEASHLIYERPLFEVLGQSAAFNGSDSAILLGKANAESGLFGDLNGAPAVSIEFWADFDSFSSESRSLIFGQTKFNSAALHIRINQNFIAFACRSSDRDEFHSNSFYDKKTILEGIRHIVVVFDYAGGSAKLFIDGIEAVNKPVEWRSDVFAIKGNGKPVTIGKGPAGPLLGNIDELAIYDFALTPEQIAQHYKEVR